MPKPLMSLAISALDDFSRVQELQTLLKIGLDGADEPSEEACSKLALLVSTYLCQVEPWLEEVELGLQRIRQQLGYHLPD